MQLLRQEGSAVVDLILATKALLESQHGPSSSMTLVRLISPQCKNLDLQVVFRLLVRIAAAVAVVVVRLSCEGLMCWWVHKEAVVGGW